MGDPPLPPLPPLSARSLALLPTHPPFTGSLVLIALSGAAFARLGVNATVDEVCVTPPPPSLSLALSLSLSQVSELLDELDVDGNNQIAIEEFLPQMRAAQNERRRQAKRHRGTDRGTDRGADRGTDRDRQTERATVTPQPGGGQGKLTMTRSARAQRAVLAQRSAAVDKHVARMRELSYT